MYKCMELFVIIYVWKIGMERRKLRFDVERIQKEKKRNDNTDVTFQIVQITDKTGS